MLFCCDLFGRAAPQLRREIEIDSQRQQGRPEEEPFLCWTIAVLVKHGTTGKRVRRVAVLRK